MMAKEKAKALFNTYYDREYANGYQELRRQTAKECALICVDEIVEVLRAQELEDEMEYWNEARAEIDKL